MSILRYSFSIIGILFFLLLTIGGIINFLEIQNNSYYIGNGGHPNELGSQMWANELENIIGELYE